MKNGVQDELQKRRQVNLFFGHPPREFFRKTNGKSTFLRPGGYRFKYSRWDPFWDPKPRGYFENVVLEMAPKMARPGNINSGGSPDDFLRFPEVFVGFAPEIGFGAKNPARGRGFGFVGSGTLQPAVVRTGVKGNVFQATCRRRRLPSASLRNGKGSGGLGHAGPSSAARCFRQR